MNNFMKNPFVVLALCGSLVLCTAAVIRDFSKDPKVLTATWYGNAYKGKPMANGRPYDTEAMTCACNLYPLGTQLKVQYQATEILVKVTDRMANYKQEHIDLSPVAFTKLVPLSKGKISVVVSPVSL